MVVHSRSQRMGPHIPSPNKIAQERVFLLPEFCHLTGLDEDTSHHKTRCFDEIFVAEGKMCHQGG